MYLPEMDLKKKKNNTLSEVRSSGNFLILWPLVEILGYIVLSR